MAQNGEINKKFGVYKSLCCGFEIVLVEGANGFPELLNFPALKRGANPPHSLSLWERPMRDSRKAEAHRVRVASLVES